MLIQIIVCFKNGAVFLLCLPFLLLFPLSFLLPLFPFLSQHNPGLSGLRHDPPAEYWGYRHTYHTQAGPPALLGFGCKDLILFCQPILMNSRHMAGASRSLLSCFGEFQSTLLLSGFQPDHKLPQPRILCTCHSVSFLAHQTAMQCDSHPPAGKHMTITLMFQETQLGEADSEAFCNSSLALQIVKAASTEHRQGLTSITRCSIGCSHSTFTSQ